MLCEIPASSYKPVHLVNVSLVPDVFMAFPKSANRRREEFVGSHCTCSHTLLWLISAALLSCCTILIKYYYVCTKSSGCAPRGISVTKRASRTPRVPPGGALAPLIFAPPVRREGRFAAGRHKMRQQRSRCPSAPAKRTKSQSKNT